MAEAMLRLSGDICAGDRVVFLPLIWGTVRVESEAGTEAIKAEALAMMRHLGDFVAGRSDPDWRYDLDPIDASEWASRVAEQIAGLLEAQRG